MTLLMVLGACAIDLDGDGLSGPMERRLGTDEENPDTDGDGLTDGEEVERGTDPLSTDTDGDGYLDGDEVFEGKDPTDPESRIYQGGWPYLRDKSMLEDPGFDTPPQTGAQIPRLYAKDQFGDTVDLADFANHGQEILIEVCGEFYPGCHTMATWRTHDGTGGFLAPEAANAIDRLEQGSGAWLTVVSEGPEYGSSPGFQDVVKWSTAYGDSVAILYDEHQVFRDWVWYGREQTRMPTYLLLGHPGQKSGWPDSGRESALVRWQGLRSDPTGGLAAGPSRPTPREKHVFRRAADRPAVKSPGGCVRRPPYSGRLRQCEASNADGSPS